MPYDFNWLWLNTDAEDPVILFQKAIYHAALTAVWFYNPALPLTTSNIPRSFYRSKSIIQIVAQTHHLSVRIQIKSPVAF